MMWLLAGKVISLTVFATYSFTNGAQLLRGQGIEGWRIWVAMVALVAFIALMGWLG